MVKSIGVFLMFCFILIFFLHGNNQLSLLPGTSDTRLQLYVPFLTIIVHLIASKVNLRNCVIVASKAQSRYGG